MSIKTNIEWADSTGSPWYGCTVKSPGCEHCFARELTLRYGWAGWGNDAPRVRSKGFWDMARKLNRRAAKPVAVNYACCDDCGEPAKAFNRPRMFPSLMDWLDPKVSVAWLAEFLELIRTTPNLDWLLLTKRPELWAYRIDEAAAWHRDHGDNSNGSWLRDWRLHGGIPHNVWIGTTVEDQERADIRVPQLVSIPAKVHFLSCEPLLESIRLDALFGNEAMGHFWNCLTAHNAPEGTPKIDWVIVGGESGPKRRDCGVEPIVHVAQQCLSANVPCFVKQDCAFKPGQQGRIPDEIWQLKQFPQTA